MGLFGDKCFRCGEKRTKKSFEGVPTCTACELEVKARREKTRLCPVDSSEMRKRIVHNIVIDRCGRCGGVWLDGGELDLLTKAIESGAESDFATGMFLGMAIG
jgi:ribosomal protein L37AE/L43A